MKIIKFDLPINGAKVRNLEELRDNFTTEIMELQTSGVLIKWAKGRGLTEEADKLSAIPVDLDAADRLVVLCEIFEVDVDRAVIEAALFESSGRQGVPLHVDPEELKYKEKFEQLSKLMDELKRKKLYLTQDDYHLFVKNKHAIEEDGKVECVILKEEIFKRETQSFFMSYHQNDIHFKFTKSLGELIEIGDVIGYIHDGVNPAYVKYLVGQIASPFRGVLIGIAEFREGKMSYLKDDPICYIRIDHESNPTIKIIPDETNSDQKESIPMPVRLAATWPFPEPEKG